MCNFKKLRMTVLGLMLLAGFLTFAAPDQAEAGIRGNVRVVNHSSYTVTVYINGFRTGVLSPGGELNWHVGDDAGDTTDLRATNGNLTWHTPVSGNHPTFTWTLTN
jgi:hypothetical protein